MPPDEPNKFTVDDDPPPPRPSGKRDGKSPKKAAPSRKSDGSKPKKGAIWLVLIASAVPIGCLVYWFTMPEEKRHDIDKAIPQGVGGRALIAVIAFGVLVALARLVLPGVRAAGLSLTRALAWFGRQPKGKRVALYVPEFFVYLGWVGTQIFFALDAIAILATGVAFLLYVARIIKPELFPWLPPR